MAWNAALVPANLAHSLPSVTWARLARAYAVTPRWCDAGSCKEARSRRWVYIPPEDTVITRRGGREQRGHRQSGQQERRYHLARDRQLGPGHVRAGLQVDGARAVEEHVEPVMGGAEPAG